VTQAVRSHPNITVHAGEVTNVPDAPAIVATGPLTSDALAEKIGALCGAPLHFYDAAAPIVSYDSIDLSKVYRASRYGRGDDYLNCPFTREEYFAFYRALISAETAELHSFETPRVFEGCMPVEVMAKRGETTLCYGPLKPVGLEHDGKLPFAVVQLRQDDAAGRLWNIVGFQTNLKFGEQKRVFGMIPGLEHAEFVRYGVMHRNTFLPPNLLNFDYQMKRVPGLFFAGQITGVEGYVESASSGLIAAIGMERYLNGEASLDFSEKTAIGALGHYVSDYNGSDFQPMNVNFGLMDPLTERIRSKKERYGRIAERALKIVKELQTN
jgi:methylenetetrahydrofolate--tRNA-(uracil-5-)-methyltransferase